MVSPRTACPACGREGLDVFYEQAAVPVNSLLLLPDAATARAFPTSGLALGFCAGCGFITNTLFDPAMTDYNGDYEETQGFSARFREFAQAEVSDWVERYDLTGRPVLEVGCGKGDYLATMVEHGIGHGYGYDPAFKPGRISAEAAARIDVVPAFLDAGTRVPPVAALVCRHTLEHVPDVADFLAALRTVVGEQPTVFLFELPDVQRILDDVAFWDVFYEHCSYFSAGSLVRLFRRAGLQVLDVALVFDGQYLTIEAGAGDPAAGPELALADDLDRLTAAVEHFRTAMTETQARWRREITAVTDTGGRVALWGSGSKSVAFLTTVGITDEISYVVDINPNKHGTYNAGTGQQIVAPQLLQDYQPDLVIIMNPVYRQEITRDLDALGVRARVAAL